MRSISTRPHGGLVARAVTTGTALLVALLVSTGSAAGASRHDLSPYPTPTVSFSFSPTTVQAGVPETFTAVATPGTGATISQVSWDLGDRSFTAATGPSMTMTFATSGTENISVEVTQSDGQTATSTQSVTVAPAAGSILSPAIVIKPKLTLVWARVSGERVSVKLSCVFAVCRTTASLTTLEHRRNGKLTAITAKAKRRTRTAKVGSSSIRVDVGRTRTYTLKLNGTGLNLLRRFGRLPLTLALSDTRTTRHLMIKHVAPKQKKKKTSRSKTKP